MSFAFEKITLINLHRNQGPVQPENTKRVYFHVVTEKKCGYHSRSNFTKLAVFSEMLLGNMTSWWCNDESIYYIDYRRFRRMYEN